MRKSQNKWATELKTKKACSFSFSPKLLTAPHVLRITQLQRRTQELYSSSTSMTTFGVAEQGVGLFLGFGKCLESQRGTDRNPRHHPGWGPNHRTAERRKVIPSEWKLLSDGTHRTFCPQWWSQECRLWISVICFTLKKKKMIFHLCNAYMYIHIERDLFFLRDGCLFIFWFSLLFIIFILPFMFMFNCYLICLYIHTSLPLFNCLGISSNISVTTGQII